jgi:metal-responsive CopG/Arc/MetJ family transcriptional regulator
MSAVSINLPESLHDKLKEITKKEGISIDQFIASAVGEKMSALMTEESLEMRAKRAQRNKRAFREAIATISDAEPEDYDKL